MANRPNRSSPRARGPGWEGLGGPEPSREPVSAQDREIEHRTTKIESLTLTELRETWEKRFGTHAPQLKGRDLLIRVLAWQLQADAFGGHSPAVKRKLAELGARITRDPKAPLFPTPTLKPGIVLTREWKGVVHRVLVQTQGFLYQEKSFASLSEVAKTITGTHWSGPRFFGIENIIRRQLRAQAEVP